MTDPITPVATGLAAIIGGITLELFGLPYHAVVWGFFGALVSMSQLNTVKTMSNGGAFLFCVLSTLVGGALGNFAVEFLALPSRAALILGSLIGGAGAFGFVNLLLSLVTAYARNKAATLQANQADPASPQTRAQEAQP